MQLRDWLNQNWPDGSLPMDVVIAIGAGVTRSLAEAWDCSATQVHGALSEDAIWIDNTGHVRVEGLTETGDRIAHQKYLRATGRMLYSMVMNEAPHTKGPRDTDPVVAALAAIRSSSLQRARERVQVAHPVVGRVIAWLLATGDEQGFSDGWAVAEALDNLGALPVEMALAPRIRRRIFAESEASDSTIFVALVRSVDRGAPVSRADKTPKNSPQPRQGTRARAPHPHLR